MKKLFALSLFLAACVHPLRAGAQSYTGAPLPKFQFFSNAGAPLAAGKVYTYACGTTTPLASYADTSGTPNANPVQLDSAGRATIYIGTSCYKFLLQNAAGTQIWSQDNINSAFTASGIGSITANTIPKGGGGGTLTNSRITDDGTTIGLGSNLKVQTSGRVLIGLASTDVVGGSVIASDSWVSATATSNAELASLNAVNGLYAALSASKTGSGSYRPLTFWTSGAERVRITTTGQMLEGIASTDYALTGFINNGSVAVVDGAANATYISIGLDGGTTTQALKSDRTTGVPAYLPLTFWTGGLERARIGITGGLVVGAPTGGDKGSGTINAATAYYINGTVGLSSTISVRKGDDSGACNLVVTSGLITSTTC